MELLRPQLASSDVPDLYTQVSWPKIIQPKFDGICCLAVNGQAYSRTMKLIPNLHVQKVFKELNLHGVHGELMLKTLSQEDIDEKRENFILENPDREVDEEALIRIDFNDVQSAIMRGRGEPDFFYVVYDYWDSDQNYDVRESRVRATVYDVGDKRVAYCPSVYVRSAGECEIKLEQLIEQGFEGGILRDPLSPYKQGRQTLKSQALMKLKKFFDDEAIIIGYEEKMTNENEKVKDERGYSKRSSHQENMVPAGVLGALVVKWRNVEFKIGSGYTELQRKQLWDIQDTLIGKPVTFKYQELSKYGVPRFPVFKALRVEYFN